MDPYSVLGVRRGASRTEIDLAYKGRRSQYHPDRYSSEDAETIAWATSMMQQVNSAYELLSNPQHQSNRSCPESRKNASEVNGGRHVHRRAALESERDVAAILLNPEWDWGYMENIFAKPNIPRGKLRNAIDSYAPEVSPREVLILVDDTVFGGAKEGIIVTGDAIYAKQKFEDSKKMEFNKISKIGPMPQSRMAINGREFFKCNLVDHLEMLTFSSRLGRVFEIDESRGKSVNDGQELPDSEPEEGLFEEIYCGLTETRSVIKGGVGKAVLELMKSTLAASDRFIDQFQKDDVELTEDEEFVLSSDVFRFEVLAYVFAVLLNALRHEFGDERAASVIGISYETIVVNLLIGKGVLGGDAYQGSEAERAKIAADSPLSKQFMSRVTGYLGELIEGRSVSLIFLKSLQAPLLASLYKGRPQEIVRKMIVVVANECIDEDLAASVLDEVEILVGRAVRRYRLEGGR